jgi:deoxyribonuclease V
VTDVAFGAGRYAAADVHYPAAGGARAAAVVTADVRFATVTSEHIAVLADVAPYRPGAFFTRELPPLRAVLGRTGAIDLLVIDGYVHLDPHGRPGLGAHAHAEFAVPVIGVAKSAFRGASHAIQVHRGNASRPLYVTAVGISAAHAADMVRGMTGAYRLPDALRRVDTLARTGWPSP